MHSHIAPSNTLDVVTRLGQSQNASCHTAKQLQIQPAKLFAWLEQHRWIFRRKGSKRWVANQLRITAGYLTLKVTALKPDPETGIERAAFDPVVTPKGLARLAEFNIGASQ